MQFNLSVKIALLLIPRHTLTFIDYAYCKEDSNVQVFPKTIMFMLPSKPLLYIIIAVDTLLYIIIAVDTLLYIIIAVDILLYIIIAVDTLLYIIIAVDTLLYIIIAVDI